MFDGIASLTFSGYVVQILILGAMLIGYQCTIREENCACRDVLFISANRFMMLLARLLAAVAYVMLLCVALLVEIIAMGVLLDTPMWIMKEAVLYWLLYFLLAGVISTMFGQIVGMFGAHKISYLILIFISISIGPLGKEFLELVATLLHFVGLRSIAARITVGQYDAHQEFDYLYGFEIESKRFYHRILYIGILFLLWNLLYLIKEKRNISFSKTRLFYSMGVVLFCGGMFFLYQQPIFCRKTGFMEDTAQSLYDYEYYEDKNAAQSGEYKIAAMDLFIDLTKELQVSGDLSIEALKDTDVLNMTLYHDLKVKSICIDDEAVPFEQIDDNITIYLGETLEKGESATMSIDYRGISSQYYFAGEKAAYLPGYFAWLPYPGKYCTMSVSDGYLKTMPLTSEEEIFYRVQCISRKPVYCNLGGTDNFFQGTSKYGVSLISGNLKTTEIDGTRILYTTDKSEAFIKEHAAMLLSDVQRDRKLLMIGETDIENLFFIPTKYERIGSNSFHTIIMGNTILSGIYETSSDVRDEYVDQEALMGILFLQYRFDTIDRETQSEWLKRLNKNIEMEDQEALESNLKAVPTNENGE